MSFIRETRGLFLPWSRLERPRQCATGLSPSTRWAVCITSEKKQMCIWHLCFSFPKRIQSWELPSTDLRSHLQMLWLDYVSTQIVNTMKSGWLNGFIVGGQAVFKPLRFWLQFFASTKPKCAWSPYFLVSLLLHIFLPNWRCFYSPESDTLLQLTPPMAQVSCLVLFPNFTWTLYAQPVFDGDIVLWVRFESRNTELKTEERRVLPLSFSSFSYFELGFILSCGIFNKGYFY